MATEHDGLWRGNAQARSCLWHVVACFSIVRSTSASFHLQQVISKFWEVTDVALSIGKGSGSCTAKLRIWTLRIWGFQGPAFRSARQVLCGDASCLFLDHFCKRLSSVLGWTELCHEVRNPGPQTSQIIRNENPPFGTVPQVGECVRKR